MTSWQNKHKGYFSSAGTHVVCAKKQAMRKKQCMKWLKTKNGLFTTRVSSEQELYLYSISASAAAAFEGSIWLLYSSSSQAIKQSNNT